MVHMGLFEGIGGFSLAARWAGWQTPVMVEWNQYCQAVLNKNFPDATIFGDIHKFDGRLMALGNAIVPQIAYQIFEAINQFHQ